MTFALIDADIVAYRASAVAQSAAKSADWGDGEGMPVSLEDAKEMAFGLVRAWTKLAGCTIPVVCLSSTINFRRHLWPAYKANRANVVRPEALHPVLDALETEFKSYRLHGLEADDAMGILLTSDKFQGSVCVTLDKDLATVPGRHFNPLKDMRPRLVRGPMADRWWMTQVLTGDSADGYGGLPGVGPKKAEVILAEAGLNLNDMWAAVVAAYVARGLTVEDALLTARLARILRRPEYDRENEEIQLWDPVAPVKLALRSLGANPPPPLKENSTSTRAPKSADASSPSGPPRRRAASPRQPKG